MKQKLYVQKPFLLFTIVICQLTCSLDLLAQTIMCGNTAQLTRNSVAAKSGTSSCAGIDPAIASDCTTQVKIPLAFHFDSSFTIEPFFDNPFISSRPDICCILEKIEEQIDVLNTVFGGSQNIPADCSSAYYDNNGNSVISSGTNISFFMPKPFNADLDPNMLPITIGQFSGGYAKGGQGATIDNGLTSLWDEYLNVFVVDDIPDAYGISDQIPDRYPADDPGPGEGVTLRASVFGGVENACGTFDTHLTGTNYNGGKTLAHEIGHYLGLGHLTTSHDIQNLVCEQEEPNTYNNMDIDVCDTPAQSYVITYISSCNDAVCNNDIQKANIMGVEDDSDRYIFTKDQACVMNYVANDLFGAFQNQPENTELEHIIDSDVTWENTGMLIDRDVIIKSGNTLTISGTEVYFGENVRLVVEKGAKLIVDGGSILTTTCDNIFWEGIQVWGSRDVMHPTSVTETGTYINHGVVFIKGWSIIENATAGVRTHRIDDNQNWDLSCSNGIAVIKDTHFINNLCSVVLFENSEKTKSKLNNIDFIINDDFYTQSTTHPNNQDPDTQVYLEKVSGLNLNNVRFNNQSANISGENAFVSILSTFAFKDSGSSITNFKIGIDASHWDPSKQSTQTLVDNVTFQDVPKAIKFSGYTKNITDGYDNSNSKNDIAVWITDNKITLPVIDDGVIDSKYGIAIEACTDYVVNKNKIKGGFYSSGDGTYRCIGIYAYNSPIIDDGDSDPPHANYIQNNIIGESGYTSNLHSGVYVDNNNPSLQVLCNTFNNNTTLYDILYNAQTAVTSPVAPEQGACGDFEPDEPQTGVAGNSFATQSFGANSHEQLSHYGTDFTITYNHAAGNEPSQTYSEDPIGRIIRNDCIEPDIQPECDAYKNIAPKPSTPDPGPGPAHCCLAVSRSYIEEIETKILQVTKLLTDYKRQDDSALIKSASNLSEVQKIISNYKAYLSNDELEAVSSKLNLESAVDVLKILEENAPLNNTILLSIQNHINSLPLIERLKLAKEYEKQFTQLYDNIAGISPRQEIILELYQLTTDQKAVVQQSLVCCRTKPNLNDLQSIADNSSLNKSFIQKKVVDLALEQDNIRLAYLTLEVMDTSNDKELADYVDLQKFYIRMSQFGKTLDDLNEKEVNALEDIANINTSYGIVARNAVLAIRDSLAVLEIPQLPVPSSEKLTKLVNPLLGLNVLDEKPFVYPNPVKDILYLNIADVGNAQQLKIKLYNSNGYLVHSLNGKTDLINKVDLSKIPQGAYFIEISDEKYELINRSKILIIK